MRSPPYLEALEWTRAYAKIAVTGSQRSGTTICARMIAADRGWDFVDETDIGTNAIDGAARMVRERDGFVLQMPNLMTRTDAVAAHMGKGGLGIVAMRRPFEEVDASRKRIGLRPRDHVEVEQRRSLLEKARSVGSRIPDEDAFMTRPMSLMEWRQTYVEHYLRRLPHVRVLDFASLAGHPLHVPETLRRDFAPKQTTPGAAAAK